MERTHSLCFSCFTHIVLFRPTVRLKIMHIFPAMKGVTALNNHLEEQSNPENRNYNDNT